MLGGAAFQIERSYSATDDSRAVLHPRLILVLLLTSSVWTIIMTAVPVLVKNSGELGGPYVGWFVGDDVIRLLEPIVSLPLQLALLVESKCFSADSSPTGVLVAFAFGAAIYQQGAGYHSAATMFKHAVDTLRQTPNATTAVGAQIAADMRYWMSETWAHWIAHYMYAAGGVVVAAVIAWVYRDVHLPNGLTNRVDRALWLAASVAYGLCIGSVAIQFPWGVLVALCFLGFYGFGVVGSALWRRGEIFTWGTRFVLQYFVLAYSVALCIAVGWAIYTRSVFVKRGDTVA
jgi:hypothetical protein